MDLDQPSINAKEAMRAAAFVRKFWRSSSSHSVVVEKLSHMALLQQSPTDPIDGLTPNSFLR